MPAAPSGEERLRMIGRHMRMLKEEKGAYTAVREMRRHISWYTAGMPRSAELRRLVNLAETEEEMLDLVRRALL